MGQKVHPIGFRLGSTEPHKSQWFARFSKYKYSQSVLEDHMLRKTLKNTLNDLFLKPLSSGSNRKDVGAKVPVINHITIERKFIPYQVIVSIHAQDCHLFKKKINNLKVNRELIAKMLKVRAFRFDLRNKINNLKVVSKKEDQSVFENQQLDLKEKRLKKRQAINYIYRQRIAKDLIISKKGNTVLQKLNLKKKTKKKIYLPLQLQGKAGLIAVKKAYALKKQKNTWFQTFPNQTLNFGGAKVLKLKFRNKAYLFKNNKYFLSETTKKKSFILNKNFNSVKKLKSSLKDPMFRKSKQIFQFRLFENQKKTVATNSAYMSKLKKKFVKIYLNKISVKFMAELKENYQDWYTTMSQNKNLSPFTFLKKWRFAQSPVFFSLLNNLKTISKKNQFSLNEEDLTTIANLLNEIQPYLVPLKKVVASLKKKIRFKFLALRKEYIAFGSISKVNRSAFYQVLYYFNYLNKFVNELTNVTNRQLAIYQFDMDNNINQGEAVINSISTLFKNNKVANSNGVGLASKFNKAGTLQGNQSYQRYIDVADGNVVSRIQQGVTSKIAITRLTRRMKMVEYVKDIIKKHRTKNLYHYLPIIAEARKKMRQNNIFIKQNSKKFFGSKVSAALKANGAKDDLKKEITPQIDQVLRKTWNFKLKETEETAYLLKLKSILQEQQRLRKTIEFKSKVRLNFFNISKKTMDTKASVVAENIALALERRQAFRSAIKAAQKSVMRAKGNIKGIKIQVAGRLNGAEIARTEWVKAGRVPLQSISSNIDYSYRTANTIYGIIGIKVWIFKGYKKVVGYNRIRG